MNNRITRREFLKLTAMVAGSAAIAGCAPKGITTEVPTKIANKKIYDGITINGIAQNKPVPEGAWKEVLGPIWKENTGGLVNVNLIDYDSLYQKAILESSGGGGDTDFFGLDIIWAGEFAVSGYAVPLNDFVKNDKDALALDPVLLQGVTWGDKIVGLPSSNQSVNLWYRKDLFDSQGIKPPTDWDDFLRLAKEFTGDWDNDGKPNYGVAMNVKRGPFIVHDWFAYFAAMGGEVFENWPNLDTTTWRPKMNGDAGVKALELYQNMAKYAPPGIMDYDWEKTQVALDTGQVAMICTWNDGVMGRVFREDSPVYNKIGWAPFPNSPDISKRFDPRGYWTVGINPKSENKEAVLDFLKLTITKEAQKTFAQLEPSMVPLRNDLLDELATPDGPGSYLPFIQELNKNDNPLNFDWRPRIPEWSNLQDIFGLALNEAMIGTKTAQVALDEGNARLEQVMKDSGYF